jgi:hypothetical protein
MPVIFRYEGYRFFFFSNEGNPLDPVISISEKEKPLQNSGLLLKSNWLNLMVYHLRNYANYTMLYMTTKH